MPNIQLANNLRYLRKQHNLTQTTLSNMLNISRQATLTMRQASVPRIWIRCFTWPDFTTSVSTILSLEA